MRFNRTEEPESLRVAGYWSTETWKRRLREVVREDCHESRITNCCYELRLGAEAFITGEEQKRLLKDREQFLIKSGQFALLVTEEYVRVPHDVIGFISMKTGKKLPGLINVSGFHVDPGFEGRLVFSVYNAGTQDASLTRGEPMFLLWMCSLDAETRDGYNGGRQNQRGITDDMIQKVHGDSPSPAALKLQLDEFKAEYKMVKHWAGLVAVAVFVTIPVGLFLRHLTAEKTSAPQAPTVQIFSGLGTETTSGPVLVSPPPTVPTPQPKLDWSIRP